MFKQNISIVGVPILYNILEEIKENLSFKVYKFDSPKDFFNSFSNDNANNKDYFIITEIDNKDFFSKKKINLKNIFFILKENNNLENIDIYNIAKCPININSLIEKINILLIKIKYNFQSEIKIKKYSLDLNSRFISNNYKQLKLTEREMDIILFLKEKKEPQKINELQNKVWRYSSELETHTVETHIYRLRKKISENFKDDKFIISTDKGYTIE
tara:strand:- start:1545 stop:2189 length:645 start_codon:yes stop_codon:yes gene_type:complete